jgi:exopolysaccharide biosynthesis polyprenyl glycosylphosphotransferase
MLRQFSTRRIIVFFFFDWFGSLACLIAADFTRMWLADLPIFLDNLLDALRIQRGGIGAAEQLPLPWSLAPVLVLAGLIWPFFFAGLSVYDGRRNETLRAELMNTFTALVISMLVLAGSLYFTYRETSRLMLLFFWILDSLLLLGGRVGLYTLRIAGRQNRNGKKVVLLVGAGKVGEEAVKNIQHFGWVDIHVVGYVADAHDKQGNMITGLPVLGTLGQIGEIASFNKVTDAIVALPFHAHDRIVEVCRKLQSLSIRVHVIPDLFALSFPNAALEGFGGIPAIDLGLPGISGWQRLWKRIFDLVVATVGLVVISPFLLFIAILIKLDSAGPILYKQFRIGENGRLFAMYKFRSMSPGCDPRLHQEHVTRLIQQNIKPEQVEDGRQSSLKLANDPRITRVGRIIRKLSIDEFPQLFNVLLGNMSLVGPRPSLAYEADVYQEWHKRRFEAPPGITGLWQVKGRNKVSFDEMVRLDLEYIRNQSLWLDIKILLQTPLAVISARGAG